MKKILFTIMLVGLLSAIAFADPGIYPYVVIENVGLVQSPSLTIGVAWSGRFGTSNWLFDLDTSYFDNNLLALQSPLQLDCDLNIEWSQSLELVEPGESIDYGFIFLLEERLIFKPGNTLVLDLFEPTIGITGFFGPIKAWFKSTFPYDGETWGFNPTIGISYGR